MRPERPGESSSWRAKESRLWRQAMQHCYGADWRNLLDQLRRAAGADDDGTASVRTTGSSGESRGSFPRTPGSLRDLAVKDIQENETLAVYEKRISRAVFALEALEEPLEEVEIWRLVLRAKTQVSLRGMDLREQVRHLKGSFGTALLEGGDDEDQLEVLAGLLHNRGQGLQLDRLAGVFTRGTSSGQASGSVEAPSVMLAREVVTPTVGGDPLGGPRLRPFPRSPGTT